jgi:hypothetical protein
VLKPVLSQDRKRSKDFGTHFRQGLPGVLGHQGRVSTVDAARVTPRASGSGRSEFSAGVYMSRHLTEIIFLSILASAVVLGVLELCWTLLESGKSVASNRTE